MAETILRAMAAQGGSSSAQILPVDVYGNSENATTWNVALGVQAAVNGGATILNMSLGGSTESAILNDVIQQAEAKGIVVFAAAGNQPVATPTYPAALSGVIAVAALLLGLNLLADRFLADARLDLTQQHLYTLSPGTKKILAALKQPVTLRLFYSRQLGAPVPQP